jgi:hypothetical protein
VTSREFLPLFRQSAAAGTQRGPLTFREYFFPERVRHARLEIAHYLQKKKENEKKEKN